MSRKARAILTMGLAMAATQQMPMGFGRDPNETPDPTPEDKEKALTEAQDKIRIKQGQKKFQFKEGFIWARSRKNAVKKAKHRGWTIKTKGL